MFNLISSTLRHTGAAGVFFLMLMENLIPVIPSELIMPMAGFEAARGALDPLLTILAGSIGSIIGGAVWFFIGRTLGPERAEAWAAQHGRWLTISQGDVVRGMRWFERWGAASVCIGRMMPVVRGVICFPAGVARMPLARFLLWSSIGATVWSTVLVLSGYVLKRKYEEVGMLINPISDGLIAIGVGIYILRLLRYRKIPATDV